MSYKIDFAESTKEHLRHLSASQRALVFDAVKKQLAHEPFVKTRNRKNLKENQIAPWELRLGDLRIFYDRSPEEVDVIEIVAVGIKKGNRLFIAGKEFDI